MLVAAAAEMRGDLSSVFCWAAGQTSAPMNVDVLKVPMTDVMTFSP